MPIMFAQLVGETKGMSTSELYVKICEDFGPNVYNNVPLDIRAVFTSGLHSEYVMNP